MNKTHGVPALAVTALTLVIGGSVCAEPCTIVNGSFEDDGSIANILVQEPNGWDVEAVPNKFKGYVYLDWPTKGLNNLTLYADWFKTFGAGEMALVTQTIMLSDVRQILFDLKLQTYTGQSWDPTLCTAMVLLDDDVVWEPDSNEPDIRGQYLDQGILIADKYRDGATHRLSLGLIVTTDGMLSNRYISHWDAIECELFCNGGGLLAGDINHDCDVNALDLMAMAETWLDTVAPTDSRNPSHLDDQQGYGIIDFFDFALYGHQWTVDYSGLGEFAAQWLEPVPTDNPYNYFDQGDIPAAGFVNFHDFARLSEHWLQNSLIPDEGTIETTVDNGLLEEALQ